MQLQAYMAAINYCHATTYGPTGLAPTGHHLPGWPLPARTRLKSINDRLLTSQ